MGALVNEQRKKIAYQMLNSCFCFLFLFQTQFSKTHSHQKEQMQVEEAKTLYTGYLYRLGAARSYPIYFMPVCVSVCIHLFV